MTTKSKILTPHRQGCHAVRYVDSGNWTTPWAYLYESEYRDALGRSHPNGRSRWWRARCNDIDCKAEIVINETSILENL